MNLKPFKIITNIRWSDTDKNDHVNNGKYFDYFEEARTTWAYENTGLMNWAKENSIQLAIIEQSCKYIVALQHPNKIEVTQQISKLGVASIEFDYEIRILGSDKIVTKAKAKLACYNAKTFKLQKFPTDLKQRLLKRND
ncbi:thioesterase [Francisella halioticida]|uniref:Thioesterase n=1 Tax=Francisella halioticida TaxID=549298 RepID=A0ABN5AX15_9GAMM|nr:thioesterase family protein [Francisella halioticida]ASG68030.1 thioesterase [Francisella halioticida]BCD90410.1 thioesterase [Francisella halioticida]